MILLFMTANKVSIVDFVKVGELYGFGTRL
jgi:hypothetical protein